MADSPEPQLRADAGPGVPYRALQRLRLQLEGNAEYDAADLPAEEFRTWRLCTLLRCTPTALEDESAVTLDWLLAVDDTVGKARRNREERELRAIRK